MLLSALSFLAGISFVQQCAELPDSTASYALATALFIILLLWWFYRTHSYRWLFQSCGFALAGVLWAILQGQDYLDHRLPEELAGKDIHVEGIIEGIPVSQDKVQRLS